MRIVVAGLVIIATGLCEAPPAAAYKLIGAGVDSCGTWTADRRLPQSFAAAQDEQWVLGFLAGIGFVGQGGDNPLDGLDADAVWAWFDNYCQANPLLHISQAAAAFYGAHPHR
jgi:hypothetical protein